MSLMFGNAQCWMCESCYVTLTVYRSEDKDFQILQCHNPKCKSYSERCIPEEMMEQDYTVKIKHPDGDITLCEPMEEHTDE